MLGKSFSFSYKEVAEDYVVEDAYTIIGVDTTEADVTITLPDALLKPAGRIVYVVDVGGNAGTENITIEDESETELAVLDADDTSTCIMSTLKAWVVTNPIGLVGPTGPTGPSG